MDVASRVSHVSVSRAEESLRRFLLLLVLLFVLIGNSVVAQAAEQLGALHWSGDKTLYDTRNNKMELIGNAAIHQGGESLFADQIIFERDTKIVHATGNAVYVGKTALLLGTEMHFNLETRTGTIIGGRVSTDQFTLAGERINKLGDGRFQAHRADYSTCKDCPQSWTLSAEDVDLEINGYAFLTNVTAKIMDAPAVWIPYLMVPIKTKRQSGLLIPQFGFTNEGFTFVQPFFWAISKSVDMTFGLGTFGGRGRRLEWEGRYQFKNGGGKANLYHLNDRTFRDYLLTNGYTNKGEGFSNSRWGVSVEQNQELPFGIQEKLRIQEVSDSLYLSKVIGDIPGNGEAYVTSDLSLSHSSDKISSFILARRYRNIMTQKTEDPRAFDRRTVHVFPQAEITSNDKVFGDGRVVGGLSLGATNFIRSSGFYDTDLYSPSPTGSGFRAGQDPIRKAMRVKLNPTAYTTFRIADVVSVVPRANYHQYFYDFHGKASPLSRGYFHYEMDVSMQFEKVYDRSPKSVFPKVKHLFRPLLTYSLIPYRKDPSHPFTNQIEYARKNGFTGYNFDNEDIVPLEANYNNTNYFPPQGNALSYGFTTQILRKRKVNGGVGAMNKFTYDRPVEWTAGQSFNFRELKKNTESQQPLSRFYSLITTTFDRATGYLDYYYIPYQARSQDTSRHVLSLGSSWTFERGVGRVLAYERSLGVAYSFNRSNLQSQTQSLRFTSIFSVNDYIMPGAAISYDLLKSRWQEANTTLTFQSPSECWKLDLGYYQSICEKIRPDDSGWCGSFRFNLSLNLTGSGFGVFGDPKNASATSSPNRGI